MATGKTINELPNVGQLTGGEMIPVSAYIDGEYKTCSTTVNDIVSKVNVDEKLKSYVSNEALETKLSSYASTASVDEKLKSYVSNESLNTKLSGYVSNETITVR